MAARPVAHTVAGPLPVYLVAVRGVSAKLASSAPAQEALMVTIAIWLIIDHIDVLRYLKSYGALGS